MAQSERKSHSKIRAWKNHIDNFKLLRKTFKRQFADSRHRVCGEDRDVKHVCSFKASAGHMDWPCYKMFNERLQHLYFICYCCSWSCAYSGPKKSPRTLSIVQIIFSFRSFEISRGIQCTKRLRLETYSKQWINYLTPFRNLSLI